MVIKALDFSPEFGDPILSSKHTTRTEKINEVVGVINYHTDFYFRNVSDVHGGYRLSWKNDVVSRDFVPNILVPPLSWSGYNSEKLETYGTLNPVNMYITNIMITEYRAGSNQGELSRLQVYDSNLINAEPIIDVDVSTGMLHYYERGAVVYRYWNLYCGMLRVQSNRMMVRVFNNDPTEYLEVAAMRFAGWEVS